MRLTYTISDFTLYASHKGIEKSECEKLKEILRKCDVEYIKIQDLDLVEKPIATPNEIKYDGIVKIKQDGEKVIVLYQKNEKFKEIVKTLSFTWDWDRSYWYLPVNIRTGTADNIMAELGNKLLLEGFSVRFETQKILEKAVNGDYEPMTQRWIGFVDGYFSIKWEQNEELYKKLLTLPKAKYAKGSIKVPERYLDAVLDMAEQYEFKFTPKAHKRIAELQSTDYRVTPKKVKKPEKKIDNTAVLKDLIDEN